MKPELLDADWFAALGQRMGAEAEAFRRLGYLETRFVVRVLPETQTETPNGTPNETGDTGTCTGLAFDGYTLTEAKPLPEPWSFDPDFVICGRESAWRRLLDEIERNGHPELRHSLNSLVLLGDELWLESKDQLREDKFYRYNQSLQEFFNLAAGLH